MLFCAALAGCALAPPAPVAMGPEAECREVFRRVDRAVAEAGVQDGMAAPVAGFPYLRASRFLASYAGEALDDARFAEWVARMSALDWQARAAELANLGPERREELGHALWAISPRYTWAEPALKECAERLAAADSADPARRTQLQAAALVPDDYSAGSRVLGLYWITRVPFMSGVRNWHREVHEQYARPLDALPVAGRLTAYTPPPGARAAPARASASALGIPEPRGEALEALFRAHAPVFIVDSATDADVPGELGEGEDGLPRVVSQRPVVYQRLSHTRYAGRALLQLNYSIWFPERPKRPGWDILGGRLDGVLWRVTLAPDGEPWAYDSIHLCGCYHQLFPTARAGLKPQPESAEEPLLVPQSLPRVGAARVTVRLAAGTHYIDRVVIGAGNPGTALEYALEDDNVLRSVARPDGGRRSVFRPDGIVPGSERGERWLFWPMGIAEPGAMRQWGRHATAFVGRRHFDDPGLFERFLVLKEAGGAQ